MNKHETVREEIQALTKANLKQGGKIDKVEGSERNATFKTRLVKTHKGSSFTINAKKRDTKKTL